MCSPPDHREGLTPLCHQCPKQGGPFLGFDPLSPLPCVAPPLAVIGRLVIVRVSLGEVVRFGPMDGSDVLPGQ